MNPRERVIYFRDLWPAACRTKGWSPKDDAQRKATTAFVMREIRGPITDSTTKLGRDEVTALFTYLRHISALGDFNASARWVQCKDDYKTFNRSLQADWHQQAAYGSGGKKLYKNRFAGAKTAAAGPLDELNAEEVRKRHMTMASRHQKQMRKIINVTPPTEQASDVECGDEAPVHATGENPF